MVSNVRMPTKKRESRTRVSETGQPQARRGFKTRRRHRPPVMRVHATLHGFPEKERELDLPPGAVADDAPRALGIRPEVVLVFRDERPLPGDAPLSDGDRVRILRIVSGGDGRTAPAEDAAVWARAKAALLVVSIVWLLLVATFLGRGGADPGWLFAYLGAIAAFAALGGLGYASPRWRYPAAVATMLLMLVVANVTFSDFRILAGGLGVLVSILLPPAPR